MCKSYNLLECCPSNTILFKTALRDIDFVYNFCRIETVEAEPENKAIGLFLRCAPIASKAICPIFSFIKLICFVASLLDHKPDTTVLAQTLLKCAPKP